MMDHPAPENTVPVYSSSEILQVMLDNHAFPANEGVAHQIELEFYVENPQPITVKLKNYQLAETAWLIKTTA